MTFNDIISVIGTNGIAIVIIAYFLFKDYKFNAQIISIMDETNKMLGKISTIIEKEGK